MYSTRPSVCVTTSKMCSRRKSASMGTALPSERARAWIYFSMTPFNAIWLPFLSPLLIVKKLRYYARFIVACLLLNRRGLVVELVEELQVLVDDYIREFKPTDASAWRLVLQEINLFLQANLSSLWVHSVLTPSHGIELDRLTAPLRSLIGGRMHQGHPIGSSCHRRAWRARFACRRPSWLATTSTRSSSASLPLTCSVSCKSWSVNALAPSRTPSNM